MNRDARQVLTEWLVLAAQQGNEAAFTDLYGLWAADLRRMALVRVERSDSADEVSTDVWLAIARGLARLDDPACFPRWAFRIVQRRSADWIRQRSRTRERDLAVSTDLVSYRRQPPKSGTTCCGCEPPSHGCRPTNVSCSICITTLPAASAKLPKRWGCR